MYVPILFITIFSGHAIRKFSTHFQAFSINLIFQNTKHAVIYTFTDAFGTALPSKTLVGYALLLCWWVLLV